jgi:hypothetical protein
MQENLIHLTKIYKVCKELDLVKSQTEFSELCGKNPSWFSVCKAKNIEPSVDAIVRLGTNIKYHAPKLGMKCPNKLKRNIDNLLTRTVEFGRHNEVF